METTSIKNSRSKRGPVRHIEVPEDSLSPAMEDVAIALEAAVPDTAVRLALVNQLFRSEPEAPYSLALERLTGKAVSHEMAADAWRITMDLQQRWSERLGEVVSMKSAAIEAVERCEARSGMEELEDSATGTIRAYLERDLATGLYLREHFDSHLNAEVKQASNSNPVSLAFLKLAGLNTLAETLGRREAADIFREIGQLIRHECRPTDIPCRYGGDFFALILPGTAPASAQTLVEDMMPGLQRILRELSVTATCGLATYPQTVDSVRALCSAAESSQNEARMKGPWTVVTYSPPLERKQRWAPNKVMVGVASMVTVGAIAFGVNQMNRPTPTPVITPTPVHAVQLPVRAADDEEAKLLAARKLDAEKATREAAAERAALERAQERLREVQAAARSNSNSTSAATAASQAALQQLLAEQAKMKQMLEAAKSQPPPTPRIIYRTVVAPAPAVVRPVKVKPAAPSWAPVGTEAPHVHKPAAPAWGATDNAAPAEAPAHKPPAPAWDAN